jgi:hypothetical protein
MNHPVSPDARKPCGMLGRFTGPDDRKFTATLKPKLSSRTSPKSSEIDFAPGYTKTPNNVTREMSAWDPGV